VRIIVIAAPSSVDAIFGRRQGDSFWPWLPVLVHLVRVMENQRGSRCERVRLKSIRGLAPGVKREQFLQLRLPGFQPTPQKRLASGDFFTVRADDFLVGYFQCLLTERMKSRSAAPVDALVAWLEGSAYGFALWFIMFIIIHFSFVSFLKISVPGRRSRDHP
jgi:hypothetical protein